LRNEKDLELRKFGGKSQTEFVKSEGNGTTKQLKCWRRWKKSAKI